MVVLDIDLFRTIISSLVVGGLLSCGVACFSRPSSPVWKGAVGLAIFLIVTVVGVIACYEEHSTEYLKGYNDYPNDAAYNKALSLQQSDSTSPSAINWYIDGYKAAGGDDLFREVRGKELDEKNFEAYIKGN